MSLPQYAASKTGTELVVETNALAKTATASQFARENHGRKMLIEKLERNSFMRETLGRLCFFCRWIAASRRA